jgi:Phasin protein
METTSQANPPKQLTWTPAIDFRQIPGISFWQNALSTVNVWNACALSSVSTLNKDWLDFINHRLEADAAYSQQLAACKSTEDWWRVTANFAEATRHEYQEHYSRLAKIGSEIALAVPSAANAKARQTGPDDRRTSTRNH